MNLSKTEEWVTGYMYYDCHSIVEFSVKWGHGNNQFLGNQEASYEEVCKACQPTGWK